MTIEGLEHLDAADAEAIRRILPQLSSGAPPDDDALARIVAAPATTLFVARDGAGTVIGTLTLAVFAIPTGVRAIIEDVVVDGAARGHGVGAALVEAALASAAARGARTVDLTSRPSRGAANRLYERLGFARRETNVYRYSPDT